MDNKEKKTNSKSTMTSINNLQIGSNTVANANSKVVDAMYQCQKALEQASRAMQHIIDKYASNPFIFWIKGIRSRPERISFQIIRIDDILEDKIVLVGIWNGIAEKKAFFYPETNLLEYWDGFAHRRKVMETDNSTKENWITFAKELIYIVNNTPLDSNVMK
jgi:hypothetical protein